MKRHSLPSGSFPLVVGARLGEESAFVTEFALPWEIFRAQKLFLGTKDSPQAASPLYLLPTSLLLGRVQTCLSRRRARFRESFTPLLALPCIYWVNLRLLNCFLFWSFVQEVESLEFSKKCQYTLLSYKYTIFTLLLHDLSETLESLCQDLLRNGRNKIMWLRKKNLLNSLFKSEKDMSWK